MMLFDVSAMIVATKAKEVGSGRYQCHCPCHDDKNPSLSITQTADKKVLFHCHAGCSQESLLDHFSKYRYGEVPTKKGRPSHREIAITLWNEALPLTEETDNAVTRYFKNRGLALAQLPNCLRYHASTFHKDHGASEPTYLPALIAKIVNASMVHIGTHRTYLTLEGQKADVPDPKKMIGDSKGGYVLLGEENQKTWALCEGIETALAIRQVTGMTVVAALTATNLSSAKLPSHVQEVHICADFDQNQTGQKAAEYAAKTYLSQDITVYEHQPDPERFGLNSAKADWLDVLVHCGEDAMRNAFNAAKPLETSEDVGMSVCIADIEKQEVNWLWHPFIPMGAVVMLEGDPGLGKSHISLAIAADISQGRTLPLQGKVIQGSSLFFAAEDDVARTLRPRLERMNADLSKIHVYDKYFALDVDGLALFERNVRKRQPKVVFFDPVLAYMGAKTDINKANEVRAILGQLAEVAAKYQCAIVSIRHLSKATEGANLLYRGSGSIAFTAAARSVLMVERHPEKDNEGVILHTKSNLSRKGSSLGFTFENDAFKWLGASSVTPEMIQSGRHCANRKGESVQEAKEFLNELLSVAAMPQVKIVAMASERGISKASLFRAKKSLGVKSSRSRDQASGWEWSLNQDPQ